MVNEVEEDQKEKEERETVIRSVPNQKITELLQNHNISLSTTAKAGGVAEKQVEDNSQKPGEQRKVVVQRQTTTLFLQKNQFRTVTGLYTILQDVMFHPDRILWLDLSYNYLERIEEEIVQNFKQLRTFYFHGNYVLNLEEVRKLGQLEHLHTLTLYGNQIEQIPGYRMWVLGALYLNSATLKKFDQVVVTRKEFDAVCVWNDALNKNQTNRLKKLQPKNLENIQRPPPLKTEDDDNKA